MMTGDLEGFREARARLAQSPHDSQLLYVCCEAAGDVAEDEFVALLEERLRTIPVGEKIRLHDLHLLVMLREKRGREAAGVKAADATTPAGFQFQYAQDELKMLIGESLSWLEKDARYFPAALLLADSLVALGAYSDAERAYERLRSGRGDHVSSVTTLDPNFHAALPNIANEAASRLVPVMAVREPGPETQRIVFTAGDYRYLQLYGWHFVETFTRHNATGVHLALHIFDMTPQEKAEVVARLQSYPDLAWSLSTEWTGLRDGETTKARGYYHAIRFIRFWQFMNSGPWSAWMIDMDTIFHSDVAELFDVLDGRDLVLLLSPGRFEPRNKVVATCTGAANTPGARAYLRSIGGYLGHYHQKDRLLWGIDQVAMFTVLVMLGAPVRLAAVPEAIMGGPRGTFQMLSSAKDFLASV